MRHVLETGAWDVRLFGLVLAAHGALFCWLVWLSPPVPPVAVSPPVMMGVLVAPPQPAPAKAITPPAARQPPRPRDVKTIATPRPQPRPSQVQVSRSIKPAANPQTAAAAPTPAPAAPSTPDESERAPAPAAVAGAATRSEEAPVSPPRSDASHLNNPAPAYPPVSRRLQEQGQVLLEVYILPDGSVGDIRLKRSSGYARLDEAASTAVRQWRYVPARRGNVAIAYWYLQPVHFALSG